MSKKLDPKVKGARKAQRVLAKALTKIVEANGGKVITVELYENEHKGAREKLRELVTRLNDSQEKKNEKRSNLQVRSFIRQYRIINEFVQKVEEAHKRTAKSTRIFKGG